jgi:hypothetical protein
MPSTGNDGTEQSNKMQFLRAGALVEKAAPLTLMKQKKDTQKITQAQDFYHFYKPYWGDRIPLPKQFHGVFFENLVFGDNDLFFYACLGN